MKNCFNQKFTTHTKGSVRNLKEEIKTVENNMNEQTFYFRKYTRESIQAGLEYLDEKEYKYELDTNQLIVKFT